MEKGRDNTLLLTVIGIATLLVAVAGATFAYFTAQTRYTDTNGSTLTIYSNTGSTKEFIGGANLTIDNIYPSNDIVWATKVVTFSSDAGEEGIAAEGYTLYLHYTNGFTSGAVHYKLTAVENNDAEVCSTGSKHGDPACTPNTKSSALTDGESFVTGSVEGIEGTFEQTGTEKSIAFAGGSLANTHVYTLEISYPNANANQNADQGKILTVRMSAVDVNQ